MNNKLRETYKDSDGRWKKAPKDQHPPAYTTWRSPTQFRNREYGPAYERVVKANRAKLKKEDPEAYEMDLGFRMAHAGIEDKPFGKVTPGPPKYDWSKHQHDY